MKTITKKIAKNGAEIWYVDGKRVSRETAQFYERDNRRYQAWLESVAAKRITNAIEDYAVSPEAQDAAIEAETKLATANSEEIAETKSEEEPEMKNQNTNAVSTPATIETKIAMFEVGKTYAAKKSVLFDSQITMTVIKRTKRYVQFQFDGGELDETVYKRKITCEHGTEKIYHHEADALDGEFEFSANDVIEETSEVDSGNTNATQKPVIPYDVFMTAVTGKTAEQRAAERAEEQRQRDIDKCKHNIRTTEYEIASVAGNLKDLSDNWLSNHPDDESLKAYASELTEEIATLQTKLADTKIKLAELTHEADVEDYAVTVEAQDAAIEAETELATATGEENLSEIEKLQAKEQSLCNERDQIAEYYYNSDDRKIYDKLTSVHDAMFWLRMLGSDEEKEIEAQREPLMQKLIAAEDRMHELDNEINAIRAEIEARKEAENAAIRAEYEAFQKKFAADKAQIAEEIFNQYAVTVEAGEVATEAEIELAAGTATEITPVDAAIETLDDDMKDEARANIEPYKAEYNAAIKDVYLDDLSGGYDENAEIIPAADLLQFVIPLALTDHSTTAYRKNPDGTFTEDKIAFARLTEVEAKIFNVAGRKIEIDNPEPEPPETPNEPPNDSKVAEHLNANAPEGWTVTVAKDKLRVDYQGKRVADVEQITNRDLLAPHAFFQQFQPLVDKSKTPAQMFLDDRYRELDELEEMREELQSMTPESKERLKTLDEMINQVKRDIYETEMDNPNTIESYCKSGAIDENGNIWF